MSEAIASIIYHDKLKKIWFNKEFFIRTGII